MTILFSISGILAVVLVTSLLVMIIASQGRRDNRNRIFRTFNDVVAEFDLLVAKRDVLGKSMIAVDGQKSMLLYLTANADHHDVFFVDLSEIDSYEVMKEYSVDFDNYSRNEVAEADVDKIKLRLHYRNGSKPLDVLFYDKNEDKKTDLHLRTHLAEEWRDSLSSILVGYGRMREIQKIPKFKMYRNAA